MNKASFKRRSKSQKHKDRLIISDRYLKGYTQQVIANELGLAASTVCYDIKVLIRWWKRSAVKNIDSLKQIELNKINKLEIEYWEAWERSKQDAETKIKKQRETDGGKPVTEAQIKAEGQTGDPRYLAGVQWCIEKRCKILGIDAPQKITPTDADGTGPAQILYKLIAPENGHENQDN